MYIVGITNDEIYEYDLSTNFDITSTVYNSNSFDPTSEDTTPISSNISIAQVSTLSDNSFTVLTREETGGTFASEDVEFSFLINY